MSVVGTLTINVEAQTKAAEQGMARTRSLAVALDKDMAKAFNDATASMGRLATANERLAVIMSRTNALKQQAARNTSNLDRSLKDAERSGLAFGRALGRVAGPLTAAAAGFVGIRATLAQVEQTIQLGQLAQQTGIAVEQLSGLKVALEQSASRFRCWTRAFAASRNGWPRACQTRAAAFPSRLLSWA